jgi:DNA-binding NtrC family response regulator
MKASVLLVDDEPSILTTLKTLLELWEFQVETAGSAAEAIAKLKASSYDMVITDLRMESDDAGFQVARAARETDYQPAVAILTAFPLLAHEWKKHGVQGLFMKPTRVLDLVRQIEIVLAARQAEKLAQTALSR